MYCDLLPNFCSMKIEDQPKRDELDYNRDQLETHMGNKKNI